MTAERSRIGCRLDPLDTLFFRDGRPFGEADQAETVMPSPQTFAGAMRTWFLRRDKCDFKKLGGVKGRSFREALAESQKEDVARVADLSFRGPWFAIENDGTPAPLVPAPATLVTLEDGKRLDMLRPMKEPALPGWQPREPGMLPLWRKNGHSSKSARGYLTLKGLESFLKGEIPAVGSLLQSKELFGYDNRTGIAIDPATFSTVEGKIYTVKMLALGKGITLYAEIEGPNDLLKNIPEEPVDLPLGGEGRRVALTRLKDPVEWPSVKPGKEDNGLLLMLTSPGIFQDRWTPKGLKPVAAAVPGAIPVSGWDMAANGPKPNRFAAPAGSVYFIEGSAGPDSGSLCEDQETASLGWGTFVEGRWSYV